MHDTPSLLRFLLLTAAAVAPGAHAIAQSAPPPLLAPVTTPPAAAITWDAAERARSPMVASSTFVLVDAAALQTMPLQGGRLQGGRLLGSFELQLGARQMQLDITSVEWVLGYRVYHGNVPGRTSAVQLTVATDGTTWGSIDVDADQYVIAYTGVADVHVLQHIDQSLLPANMRCGTDNSFAVAAPPMPASAGLLNSNCGLTTIDILVFYTPLARQNAGGVTAIEAAIVGAIADANAGNLASGVPAELRLVHMAETNYAELGTSTDLSRFRSPTDGYMDEVHALRDTYGGDLMHLITSPASASYCGIGYLMTNLSTGFASSAFAVTVRTCIPNHTLTHECGHNMGSHHDLANAGPALYPYSYGYRTPDNAYRTIMAYSPGTRINRWSGPNVQYLGYTMGNAGTEDNVLSLNNTISTVAQFRATQAPIWCDLAGGIPGASGLPTLTGAGTINLADPLTLTIRNYGANGVGVLILGASAVDVPLFGGTLVPAPDITLGVFGSGGDIVHDASWLANLGPGFEAWIQVAFLDAAAVQGLAASDAVKVTVP